MMHLHRSLRRLRAPCAVLLALCVFATVGTGWPLTARASAGADIVGSVALHDVDPVCGYPGDFDGTVYSDGYWSTSTFVNGFHTIYIDLAMYRLPYYGHCLRAAYTSIWFPNGDYGYIQPRLNIYSGSRGPWVFDHGVYWATGNFTWSRVTPGNSCWSCNLEGPWGSATALVTLPNNQTLLTDFGESTGHGRHANTDSGSAWDPNVWSIYSHVSTGWFEGINEP